MSIDTRLEIVLAAKDMTATAFNKVQARTKALSNQVFSMQGVMTAAAGAAGLGLLVSKSLDAADKIGKVADRIGISTGALQEYRHAAGLSGVSTESLDKALVSFTKRLGEAQEGTGSLATYLGKSNAALLEQVKNAGSSDRALELLFQGMSNAGSAAERSALAAAAFGRAGSDMTVMVKAGAEGLAAMRQEARDLGLILDDNLIRSSEAANDAIAKVTGAVQTGWLSAVTSAAPQITHIADEITAWNKANRDLIDSTIAEFVGDLGEKAEAAASTFGPMIKTFSHQLGLLWEGFNSLPDWVREVGIAGAFLGGRKGAFVAAGLFTLYGAGKKALEGFSQVLKGNIAFSELATMNSQELAARLAEVEEETGLADKALESANITMKGTAEALESQEEAQKKTTKATKEGTEATKSDTKAKDENREQAEKLVKALEDINDQIAKEKFKAQTRDLGSNARAIAEVNFELDRWIAKNPELAAQMSGQIETLRDLRIENLETASGMTAAWEDFGEYLDGQISGVFAHEFESVGDFFADLLDDMYSMFTSWVAKVAAQQIVFSLSDGAAGANTLASIFSGSGSSSTGGGFSSIMNLASLASKAKSGYEMVTSGSLLNYFYTPASYTTGLAAGANSAMTAGTLSADGWAAGSGMLGGTGSTAGSFSAGGLTAGGIAGIAAIAALGQHMAAGYNQDHGYNDIWINGEKITVGDAFSGQFFTDQITQLISGVMGGGPSGFAYMDAAIMAGDWGEALKGLGVESLIGSLALSGIPLTDPLSQALLGNPLAGVFGLGDKPKSFRYNMQVGFERDEAGNLVPTGWGDSGYGGDYAGTYLLADGPQSAIVDAATQVDEYVGQLVGGFADSVNVFAGALPEPLAAVFDQAVDSLLEEFLFNSTGKSDNSIDDYLSASLEDLETELGDVLAPTVSAFYDLNQAINEINPAFGELLGSLNDAAAAYYDPLLQIDKLIADQGGGSELWFDDIAQQTETYKTLFDNAIANNASWDLVAKLGQSYSSSLLEWNQAALDEGGWGFDQQYVVDELQRIREAYTDAAGDPADFHSSMLASMDEFRDRAVDTINSLVTAITDLHPEIKLDVNVDVDVVGNEATAAGSVIQRSAA